MAAYRSLLVWSLRIGAVVIFAFGLLRAMRELTSAHGLEYQTPVELFAAYALPSALIALACLAAAEGLAILTKMVGKN